MARSIWSGSISFGLVNVPVKLYTAVARKSVHFHQLHDADGSRIQQKRFCAADGEEVAYENIVKGYEVSPGRYVVVEPAELESLDPKKTRLIEIEQFVDQAEIDPILYDQPYYLAPGTGAAKAYRLMLDAMREEGKVAIARVVLRQKEHLVALRATDDVLIMATLVFADEVVAPSTLDELTGADVEVSERELKVARQLIEMLSGPFDATHYRDGSDQEAQHRSQCGVGTRVAGGKRSDRDGDEERQGTFRTDDDLTGRAEEGVSHGWQQEGVEPSDRREPGEFGVRHGRWNGQSSHRHPCDDVVPPVPLGVSRHAGRDRERARQQWRLLPGSEG